MSESGDYSPGIWSGYDFDSARRSYDKHVGRSYDSARSAGKTKTDLICSSLTTKSESPLVIACDITGSMGEWPATIFSKLPYLELEGQEYLGKNMKISFAAIGDIYYDEYPLQTRKFTSGKGLEKTLKELVIEGGGGCNQQESYDLTALYYTRKVTLPNAIKPIFIFIGDEGLYDFVDPDYAKSLVGVDLGGERLSTKTVMEDLQRMYSVYLVRKPYDIVGGNQMSAADQKIQNQWEDLIGIDRIAMLPEAGRVVDVIFGILAQETSRIDYFREELTDRQNPDQVKKVLKSLHSIHRVGGKNMKKLKSGMSVMKRNKKAKGTQSLL